MKNRLWNLLFFLFLSLAAFPQNGKFTFTISSPVMTSAGVFQDDSILVRTLWNCKKYAPGTYTDYWDGKDDFGKAISSPVATYTIKVLSNNVQYTWQGTLGNTSDSMTGESKHQGYYNCMLGLAFAKNGYGYFCNGYSEGKSSYSKLLTSSPKSRINLYLNFSGRVITLTTEYVATDDVNVYWAGYDPNSPANLGGQCNSMVHAIRTSDDGNVSFAQGSSYKLALGGVTFPSVISKMSAIRDTRGYITGLAVQKSGKFLFVSRGGLNQLQVIDKSTGRLAQTLSYSNVRKLCIDANDDLWMITGTNTVSRYDVNPNGTLSSPTLTLTGLVNALALQVSYDGNTVAVADGGTSQQVKFFSSANGSLTNTLGTAGGYFTSVDVNNNKFYLSDTCTTTDAVKIPFIAYQPNGSFWVNDPGNMRVQHFSSGKTFIETIMSLGASYNVYADPNDQTRVWAGTLEFAVDYSKPLTGSTGWTLVRNWGAKIGNSYMKPYFEHPTTFPNGRTYALISKPGPRNNREIVEFLSTGQLRFTRTYRTNGELIAPNCDVQSITKGAIGGVATVYRYAFKGFDALGNPTWNSTPEVLATTPTLTMNDPNDHITGDVLTSSNKVIIWNPDVGVSSSVPYKGYHLGSIARNKKSWLFKTELATHTNYKGPYPEAGRFDIGNNVYLGGGTVSVFKRNVITSYHGEFWKNGQTNKYNHYLDDGLAIGQFGTVKDDAPGNAPAMYCGNALTPMVVGDPSSPNSMYLYHGDEAAHSGVHRWKITGLNTISEQSITIPFPTAYTARASNYLDLMKGLPWDVPVPGNVAGWTRNPASNVLNSLLGYTWYLNTSLLSYDNLSSNDISIDFKSATANTSTLNRDLGSNNVTDSWKISGQLMYPMGNNVNAVVAKQFLEVLDANGKLLTTFYVDAPNPAITTIYGNTAVVAKSTVNNFIQTEISNLLSFEVKIVKGKVTFTYGNYPPVTTTIYDATGNWKTPKTLRIKMLNNGGTGPARLQKVAIKDFKFYEDYTLAANKAPVANAGADTTITLPSVSTTLNGFASDSDGVVVSYSWVQLSGISLSGLIGTPNTTSTLISALLPGVYEYELTVTDDLGAIGKDTVQITVDPLSTNGNLLPAVNPANIAPGLNYSYYEGSWNVLPDFSQLTPYKTGVANTFSLAAAAKISLYAFDFTGYIDVPADGLYTFYTSSDDGSNLSIDNVPVVSNDGRHSLIEQSGTIGLKAGKHLINSSYFQSTSGAAFLVSYDGPGVLKQIIPASRLYRINAAPVADAGSNITIVLPASTTSLRGSGLDADGTVNSYSWKKLSGPANDIITSPNSATSTLSNLKYGQYQYALTVTDNNGLSATDLVWVTVDSANSVHSAPVGRPAPGKSSSPAATTPVPKTPAGTTATGNAVSVTKTSPVTNVITTDTVIAATRNKFDISDFGAGNSLKIYPNPVTDFANLAINSSGNGKKMSISVYNASGMLVDFKELSAVKANMVYKLDISRLNGGIYTLRVRFDTGEIITSKLVKN